MKRKKGEGRYGEERRGEGEERDGGDERNE